MAKAKFTINKSNNGKYYFNLHATNSKIIATSEMYETKAGCENGIESVNENAPNAEIDDQTK